MTATLKTRKPTGAVPWPLILIEGGEKSGKSWAAAVLSASPRVGRTAWIDLAEGAGDEYGAIPGVRYELVEHDGTWKSIYGQVLAAKAEAAKDAEAGLPPFVLVLDSGTAEWELLKGIADAKARERLAKRGRRIDPDETPKISMDLWNEASDKHRKLMTHLMTFPGIVIITARGKVVAEMDDAGRPVEGAKEYKVEGQKGLAYDATVWIRFTRGRAPQIIGARSVHAGIKPYEDKPREVPGLTLETVIFDVLKCDPAKAHVRDLVPLSTQDEDEPQRGAASEASPKARFLAVRIDTAGDKLALTNAWGAIAAALKGDEITKPEADRLAELWHARKAAIAELPPAAGEPVRTEATPTSEPDRSASDEATRESNPGQWDTIAAGWSKLGLDDAARLAKTAEILGVETLPDTWSMTALTFREALKIIDWQTRQSWSDVDGPADTAKPLGVTKQQHAKMHALWQAIGYAGDRDRRMGATVKMIGRPIASSSELTADEADTVIRGLEAKQRSDAAKARQEQDDRELAGVGR